ncbi:hypothetical protein [Allosphingosinicella deserti]|uniref:Uncharacterized protein n=1 Tax=Allosphingosinicella deserti TaxID=2116704 RepID=A0A2P7QIZ0_9SPHN|nr:hypothetical protein [Sphingomonas deserti]PSJ37923.1 hypothetical protein C7I55_19630 [Sphingomonas deserti]
MVGSIVGAGAGAILFVTIAAGAQAQAQAPALGPNLLRPIVPSLGRPCRSGVGEEIVVCARREEKRSPYRIPEPPDRFDPGGSTASVSRERNSLLDHGDTGIGSCSAVGPGGSTGCMLRQWKKDDQQWADQRPSLANPGGRPN